MYIVIFVTCGNKEEAKKIAAALIDKRLAACVNIMDGVESFFWWQGKVDEAKEALLMIKTKKAKFAKIVKLVKSIHSYEVPEIIALPVVCGYAPYLGWINECIRNTS